MDDSRLIAKRVISQWENHDKFRIPADESKKTPDQVIIAKALLRVDAEYGCEVRDPSGTIWDYSKKVEQERDALQKQVWLLQEEIRVLRLYGNKDCTPMADETLSQTHNAE